MAFTSPAPQVSQVTASVVKQVSAVGSAGPTDAGLCHAWWEIELVEGTESVVARANPSFPNDFSVVRSRTDIFSVPLGQNWNGKRIRFVVQANADPTQVFYSSWQVMSGANFDNQTTTPAPADTAAATAVITTVAAQQLRKAKAEQDRKRKITVSSRSRIKMCRAYIDSDKSGFFADRGVVLGPLPKLEDFFGLGQNYKLYRIPDSDIGFLDYTMTRFQGQGNEDLWWTISYANAVIDPETDLKAGEVIAIPDDDRISSWLNRSPTPTSRSS